MFTQARQANWYSTKSILHLANSVVKNTRALRKGIPRCHQLSVLLDYLTSLENTIPIALMEIPSIGLNRSEHRKGMGKTLFCGKKDNKKVSQKSVNREKPRAVDAKCIWRGIGSGKECEVCGEEFCRGGECGRRTGGEPGGVGL